MKRKWLNHGLRGVIMLQVFVLSGLISACKKSNVTVPVADANNSAIALKINSIDNTMTNRLGPPSAVSALYSTTLNPAVSDDFNDSSLDMNKWQYRTDGTSDWGTTTSSVYMATTGSDKFVSIKGTCATQTGSGISSKDTVKYGFYIVRWQTIGWTNNGANGWHPSIWGSGCDFSSSGNGNCIPPVINHTKRLEADFMEGFQGNPAYWKSHLLLWDGSGNQNIDMRANQSYWPNTTDHWVTLGFEYTPTYIAVWYYNGTWTKNMQIPFSTAATSATNMNNGSRTPLYWIFSNKVTDSSYLTANSYLHIDYFYHYSYIGS